MITTVENQDIVTWPIFYCISHELFIPAHQGLNYLSLLSNTDGSQTTKIQCNMTNSSLGSQASSKLQVHRFTGQNTHI